MPLMANIQRRRRKVMQEVANVSILAERFPSTVLAQEYEDLLAACRAKGDLRTWGIVLNNISDRIHGKPAQVITHEDSNIHDIIEEMRLAAIEGGFIEVIDRGIPLLEGEVVENGYGDSVDGVTSTGEPGGEGTIPADLLAGGQLSPIGGAESLP